MNRSDPKIFVSEAVRGVLDLHGDMFSGKVRAVPIRDQLEIQAEQIVKSYRSGNPAVVTHLECWHPEWVGHSAEQIMSYSLTPIANCVTWIDRPSDSANLPTLRVTS